MPPSNVGEDVDSPCDDDEGMRPELRKDIVVGRTCEEDNGKQTGGDDEEAVTALASPGGLAVSCCKVVRRLARVSNLLSIPVRFDFTIALCEDSS